MIINESVPLHLIVKNRCPDYVWCKVNQRDIWLREKMKEGKCQKEMAKSCPYRLTK